MKILKFNNVSMLYKKHEGIHKANFGLNQGEFVFLTGPSGAGKSTVIQLILMARRPQTGNITVGQFDSYSIREKEIPLLRRQIGCVFQDFRLLDDRNIYDNVAFCLRVIGRRKNEIKKRVMRVLGEVGLTHKRYEMPNSLSGGEQQRIAIARALANEPMLILADEPTGNLDPDSARGIMDIFQKINLRGTAILMATHNYSMLKQYNYRVLEIKNGVIRE